MSDTARAWATFLGLAVALALLVAGHPLWTGRVYSEADLLFEEYPWAAHRPAGFERPGNTLLGDAPKIFYPFASHARAAIRQGRLPTWNPRMFGGQPFLGATQSALFSPLSGFVYLIPLPDGLTWLYLARLLVGGVGMFVLLGTAGLGPPARVLGGVAWLLNPFTIVWLAHPVAEAASWMPWLAWATWRCVTGSGWRRPGVLALVTAAAVLAGHPETAFKALLLSGLLALGFVWRHGSTSGVASSRRLVPLGRALAGVGLGVALAAVQILPSLEYLNHSRILAARQAAKTNVYVVPPETAVTAVVPNFLGHPTAGTYLPMENRHGLPSNYAEQQAYAGVVIWLLAAVGAWARRRDPLVVVIAGSMTAAAALMYGLPGFIDLVTRLPGFDVLVLSRFGLVVIFGAVWLAATGLDLLAATPRETRAAPALAALAGMVGLTLASLLFLRRVLVASRLLPTTLLWCAWMLALGIAALAILVLLQRRRLSPGLGIPLLTCLTCVDLVVFAWGFHPTVPRSWVFPRLPEIDRLAQDRGLFRVIGWHRALVPNAAMVYGLSDARGYDGIAPREWSELLDTAMPSGQHHELVDARAFPLLDLLNVRYVFTPPEVTLPADRFTRLDAGPAPVWRNERAFPRAFLVSDVVAIAGREPALRHIAEGAIDLRRAAVLEAPPEGWPPSGGVDAPTAPDPAAESAEVTRYEDDLVEVVTEAPAPRLLVLSDAFFPGWSASIDGRPAALLRANHALRAVALPAGRHRVAFHYRPTSLAAGAAISGVAALGILVGLIGPRRRAGAERADAARIIPG